MSEWISVKDRLPEDMTPVLCAYRHWVRDTVEYGRMIASWDGKMYFEQGSGLLRGYYEATFEIPKRSEAGNVTHWQPLPAPPEGAKQ